ncbi:MAG: CRISPR-associated CARF protein Csa3 [Thermoproteota archaeon]
MKTLIVTLGWVECSIVSAILRHGLSRGDKIVLLLPEKKDEKSRKAIEEVRDFVSKYVPTVSVSEIIVPIYNPTEAISTLVKAITEEVKQKRELIVNLSGGMRTLILETLLALTMLKVETLTLELQTEDKVDLQLPKTWEAPHILSSREIRIFKTMGDKGLLSLSHLAKTLKLPIATVHRLVERFENKGFVVSKRVGKERAIELTEKGRIMLALLS